MKSFADWTDEIRALMNPPAPLVDTCNLSALEVGTAIHESLDREFYSGSQWPETIGFDLAEGEIQTTGAWLRQQYRDQLTRKAVDLSKFMGQLQREPLPAWHQEFLADLAKYGEALYEFTPTGRIKLHSTNELLKRGIIRNDEHQMMRWSDAVDPADFSRIEQRAIVNAHDQDMLDLFIRGKHDTDA